MTYIVLVIVERKVKIENLRYGMLLLVSGVRGEGENNVKVCNNILCYNETRFVCGLARTYIKPSFINWKSIHRTILIGRIYDFTYN